MEPREDLDTVLLLSDERGPELVHQLGLKLNEKKKNFTVEMEVWYHPKATLSDLVKLAQNEFDSDTPKFDFIYVFAGAHDLVKYEGDFATGVFDNVGSMVNTMFEKFEDTRNKLRIFAHRPVICQLIGLDIYRYNERKGDMQIVAQNAINNGIIHLNRAINSLNKDMECVGPWLGSSVHATIHHRTHHKYLKLKDGFLPSTPTNKYWADLLAQSILKNCAWKEDDRKAQK